MFRRSKSETSSPADQSGVKPDGKGRPTPSRKEAEAAAKARAQVPRTRKDLARAQRAAKTESSQNVRAAMKAGDERYYMARDRGPVRRFVRDFVDSRFSFIELMIPLLILTMVLGYSGNSRLASIGNTILLGTILLVVLDMVMLRFRLRKELSRRFPDEDPKGTTYYALTRGLQMKFMRLPKPKVKIGQSLPEHYR
ncbi:MAG: integral rane protein [Nocardioides sp.]|nr:integral rane protein [Nocardioides sp.]